MKIEILKEIKNPLFNRKEITGMVRENLTPSRTELIQEISKKFSTDKKNIKIKKIHGKFGSKEFKFYANIYENQRQKEILELKKKKEAEAERIEQEKESKENLKQEKPE